MKNIVGKPQTIKKVNEDLIKNIIKNEGPITKPEISNITELSLATVNKIVEQLALKNEVKVSGLSESTGGRRAQLFEINANLEHIIALYYYRNCCIGVVANLLGEIIYQEEFNIRMDTYENVNQDTFFVIDTLIKKEKGNNIRAIGIGVPGVVKKGVVKNIPTIKSWEGINLENLIKSKYNTKVFIENDTNITTIGIYQKQYKDKYKNMALMYLEDGIGSGIVINGELYLGSTNFAGELSYLNIEFGKYNSNNLNLEDYIMSLRKRYLESKDNKFKKEILSIISNFIRTLVCVLNPQAMIIQCSILTKSDMEFIEKDVSNNVGEENFPKLIKVDSLREGSINGVVSMCLKETDYQYSLSNKKGGY